MSTRGGAGYASGKNAVAICQRCSKKIPYLALVYDGQYPDMRVCVDCWDPKHPQEYLPDTFDPITLYDPTGDPDAAVANQITVEIVNGIVGTSGITEVSGVQFPLQIGFGLNSTEYNLTSPSGAEGVPLPPASVMCIDRREPVGGSSVRLAVSEEDIDTWTLFDFNPVSAAPNNIYGLAYSLQKDRWVAVGGDDVDGNPEIWSLEEGVDEAGDQWTRREQYTALSLQFKDVEWANGFFIAIGASSSNFVAMRSEDGVTWETITASTQSNVSLSIRYRKNDEWWVGLGNGPLRVTTDNGATWSAEKTGIFGSGGSLTGIEFSDVDADGDRKRAHVTSSEVAITEKILYSDDDGASWTKANVAQTNDSLFDIKRNPNTGTIIAVGGSGKIFRSTDNGINYSTISGPATASYAIRRIIFDNSAENPYEWILSGTDNGSDESFVWTSDDDGLTWTQRIKGFGAQDELASALASKNEYTNDK